MNPLSVIYSSKISQYSSVFSFGITITLLFREIEIPDDQKPLTRERKGYITVVTTAAAVYIKKTGK